MNIPNPIPATLVIPGQPAGVDVNLMAQPAAGDHIEFTNGQTYLINKVTVVLDQDLQGWSQTKIIVQL